MVWMSNMSCDERKLILIFNGIPVSREEHTKLLGGYLDSGLNFSKHIREAVMKATKDIIF